MCSLLVYLIDIKNAHVLSFIWAVVHGRIVNVALSSLKNCSLHHNSEAPSNKLRTIKQPTQFERATHILRRVWPRFHRLCRPVFRRLNRYRLDRLDPVQVPAFLGLPRRFRSLTICFAAVWLKMMWIHCCVVLLFVCCWIERVVIRTTAFGGPELL